ncbi:MAG: hypothetical protein LUQ67_01870, partial [Methanomicrobiales archaeon]|nr:hypothetical protein [Methanomicrobiales archaeon]
MGDHPAVNTHVLFLLLAISILYLVFSFTLWIPLRVLVQGDTPLGLMTDGLFVLVFLGQVALFAVLIYAGLYLGRRLALGAPLLEGWFAGEPVRDRAVSALKVSVAAGLGVAAIKYLLDLVIFSPFLPATLSGGRDMHLLLRLAIPFQQGIGDEIIYRLFWMTMFVWILWKLRGSGEAPGAW